MNKILNGLILALAFTFSAHASTPVTLGTDLCTNSKICYSVPNDAGDEIDLYAINIHPYVYLYVNGVQYKGTFSGGYPYPNNIVEMSMQDATGDIVYLTATFHNYTTCTRYCTMHWSLISGSIQ